MHRSKDRNHLADDGHIGERVLVENGVPCDGRIHRSPARPQYEGVRF